MVRGQGVTRSFLIFFFMNFLLNLTGHWIGRKLSVKNPPYYYVTSNRCHENYKKMCTICVASFSTSFIPYFKILNNLSTVVSRFLSGKIEKGWFEKEIWTIFLKLKLVNVEKFCGHKWKTILNIIINRFYLFSFNFQSTRGIFLCWVKSCVDQCILWGPHLIKITRREFSLNYLKDLDSGIWSLFSLSLLLISWYQTSGILMVNTNA